MFTREEWLNFYDKLFEQANIQAIADYVIKHCVKMIKTDDGHFYYILYFDRSEEKILQFQYKQFHKEEENNERKS